MQNEFDPIRPYYDEEIPAAMARIADDKLIPSVASYLELKDIDQLKEGLRKVKTAREFQMLYVRKMVESILMKTTHGFTVSGIENIRADRPYLFVSNHRDIVLDAMLLDYVLVVNEMTACQICFGSNLLCLPVIEDFGKANKMFRIERSGNMLEFYQNLALTSKYIRHVVTEEKESVWIAQRNGRTKDGNDATDPALVKMLGMSRSDDRVASLDELNIVPVAVSYEWESCDKLKTIELYVSQRQKYEKKEGEDLNSILTGIKQQKGKVHFHICKPISKEDLMQFEDCGSGLFFRKVAELMDERINGSYHLMPNNYIAHDLRSGTHKYDHEYTSEQKERFEQHMAWIEECKDFDQEALKSIFLGIYANPVDSYSQHVK